MKSKSFFSFFLLIGLLGFTSLIKPLQQPDKLPKGFPAVPTPEDNQQTVQRIKLGEKLFFEKRFSIDRSISCASCHRPEFAFSDTVAFSKGANDSIADRNTPSILNVAYHPYFMREGGVPTLEMQVLVPIQEAREFNHNIVLIAEELALESEYQRMSQEAYGQDMNPYVISRALSAYERSLISGNSPYDDFHFVKDSSSMDELSQKGMELFFSQRTNCSTCHSGFNFTDYSIRNNGLKSEYEDEGKKRLTGKESDLALFKVPSLRNAAITAPYMHNGSMATLEEVIEHYNRGGQGHVNQDSLVRPLLLSDAEKMQLKMFLISLTIICPAWKVPSLPVNP